ncbi:hypothetical protein SFUMM280S_02725 [Streptomyces fumanus]
MPRSSSSRTTSSSSYAGTRQRREPRTTTTGSVGMVTCEYSARRSTRAIRASPLTVAATASSVPPDLDVGDQVVDGGLPHGQLAQGRQDLDVVQEGPVRADHQRAGPGQPLAVRVQQVGDPVQAHGES